MSYSDWRDWALGKGAERPDDHQETWRRVAENADCDACYEHPDVQPEAYRNDLGEQHPITKEQFNQLCRSPEHQLTGMPVEGTIPNYLARCVKEQSVKTQVTERLENEERAGRPFGQTSTENHEVALPEISSSKWHPAGEVLPSPLDDFYLADFRSNRVFATLGVRENGETSEEPNTFYEYLQRVQRPDHSLAEEAVYCLALAQSVEFPQERILLLYEADPFETFRYPVPPDAEFWPLFRPIEREEGYEFGRTCPGGPPCDEERDEPELVHGNPPISSDRVWIRAL